MTERLFSISLRIVRTPRERGGGRAYPVMFMGSYFFLFLRKNATIFEAKS